MNDTVLLTGATGFVGMEVMARLVSRDDDTHVITLIRAEDHDGAQARLHDVLATLFDDPDAVSDRVTALPGDIALDGLGLSDLDRQHVVERATSVIHCAASIAFDLPLLQAMNINAGGAERVAEIAREIAGRDRLRRVVHVSTAYVAGRYQHRFFERELAVGQAFRNSYEHSKFHAEALLRDQYDLPLTIVRPSIIVGDSRTGWTPAFNVIYWPLRAFATGRLDAVPADPNGRLDVVPVDYVADGVVAALEDHRRCDTIALVAGEQAITIAELAELASEQFGRPAPRLGAAAAGTLAEGEVYLPYFDVKGSFDDRQARTLLGDRVPAPPSLAEYFETIVDYAQRAEWGRTPMTRSAAASRRREPALAHAA
jgi:thioester reductase-like protein